MWRNLELCSSQGTCRRKNCQLNNRMEGPQGRCSFFREPSIERALDCCQRGVPVALAPSEASKAPLSSVHAIRKSARYAHWILTRP